MLDHVKKVLNGQPLYVKSLWWSMTIVLIIWTLPWIGIALINPFWFRNSFFDLVELHTQCLANKRDEVLGPLMNKYKLFDKIKSA